MTGKKQPSITREQIISGAAQVFDDVGYGNAALSAITAAAKVTKGALYFHFESKEQLALAVIEAQHSLAMNRAHEAAGSKTSPLQAMVAMTEEFARLLVENVVMRAGIKLTLESSTISVPVVEPYLEWVLTYEKLTRNAIAAGELRSDLDAENFARFIVSSFTGTQIVSDVLCKRTDLRQRVEQMWSFVLGSQTISSDSN